jgi:hypothetical protein
VVAVWCYERPRVEPALDAVLERYDVEIVGPHWPRVAIGYVRAHYQNLPFPFEPEQMPPLTATAEWVFEEVLGHLRSWSATRYYQEAHHRDPLSLVTGELERAWGDRSAKRLVSWPLHMRAGRVRG